MRKIIAVALCLIMILGIVACKDNDTVEDITTDTSAATNSDGGSTTEAPEKNTETEAQVGKSDWTKLY
jgi:hypothetical protein